MRKFVLFIALTLIFPLSALAKGEILTFYNAYIWGQSNRNNSKKGSAIDLTTGKTYSLSNVLAKTTPENIDMLCFWGKVGRVENQFYLFAPSNNEKIDWTPKRGTLPYCEMIGSQNSDSGVVSSLKNWKVRNATKMQIKSAKKCHFDTATFESIDSLTVSSDFYIVGGIKPGDIILFELASTSVKKHKKGLIKIVSIEDDPERPEYSGKGANQKINMIIKVQK